MADTKTLDTLITYYSNQLDEKRREMVQLEQRKADIETALEKLAADLLREQEFAVSHPELQFAYNDYAARVRKRREHFEHTIENIEKEMKPLADIIFDLYSDVKKYEISKDNAIAKALENEKHQETVMLDEVASVQHIRNNKNT